MVKRIAIIGTPGCGKSTLAAQLSKELNLPLYHLDTLVFNGKIKRPKKEFLKQYEEIIAQDAWIVEGCSIKTLNRRFERAEQVIYLKVPRIICLFRILKRYFNLDETLKRSGCAQSIYWELVQYTWNFERDKEPIIFALQKKHPHVDFRLLKKTNLVELVRKT